MLLQLLRTKFLDMWLATSNGVANSTKKFNNGFSSLLSVFTEVQQKMFSPYTKCHKCQGDEGGLMC